MTLWVYDDMDLRLDGFPGYGSNVVIDKVELFLWALYLNEHTRSVLNFLFILALTSITQAF